MDAYDLSSTTDVVSDVSIKIIQFNIDNTNGILDELQCKLEKTLQLQQKLMTEQNEVLNDQDKILSGYLERLTSMEEEATFKTHISSLCDRLLDDQDQSSKKRNLLLEGIEMMEDESPGILLDYIKSEVKRSNLDVEDEEFDKALRVGSEFVQDGRKHQDILLQMKCCLGRNEVYKHRHLLHFDVFPDLTSKRQNMLKFAESKLQLLHNHGTVDQVYVDLSCKLHLMTKCGIGYAFSSESEFLSLLSRFSEGACNNGSCKCKHFEE